MLSSLYIKNLAIIDELNVSFNKGLNIITGETGAGKSLIIKAIQLLMGKKFSPEILRTGSNTLVIEGVFKTENDKTVIRRLYRENKESKSFINDKPVTQKKLLKTTCLLADLHGQHDHQNLLNSNTHLNYLDSYGDYNSELKRVGITFRCLRDYELLLDGLLLRKHDIQEKNELHEFQLIELTEHPISIEFENDLNTKYKRLSMASEIKESLLTVSSILENGDAAIIKSLNKIMNVLEKVSEFDNSILNIQKRAESNRIDLEDLVLEIQNVKDSIIVYPGELGKVNEIIAHIEMLKRKYGGSIDSAIEYRDNLLQAKIESGGFTDEINKLEEEIATLKNELLNYSIIISKNRKNTAAKLEEAIKNNLKHLNMSNTQFKIQLISDSENIMETGMDRCEFFISTNIGEDVRPVAKIASGGEISRIMLAIKMALQSKDMVDTLIFDEIDAGISGATAERVGGAFEKLAESHQILCITHLSQIAGKGNTHYKVCKNIKDKRIVVDINKLSKPDRIGEIATLISGIKVTDSSRKQAEELLQPNG